MKTIAFFGHRQIFDIPTIKERLMKTLKDVIPQGFTRLLIGCHGDFDNLTLSTCVNYKNNIDCNIKVNVVVSSLSFLNKVEYGYSRVDYFNEIDCENIFYDIE